jgi:hypothetical protein
MEKTYNSELNEIIYRELLVIGSKTLIERYNKALEKLTGKRTSLNLFHIDRSGYSPEIALEFEDNDYLDTFGINKKFIIVSLAQKDLPVIRSHFSSTGEFLKEFIDDNHECILTLSALDSIYGELENNIHRIESIQDVVNADTVQLHIETPKQLVDTAHHLNEKISKLKSSGIESWLNDSFLLEISDLAKKTGNIKHNSIIPKIIDYTKSAYYTSHFGGLYIFKDLSKSSLSKDSEIFIIYMDKDKVGSTESKEITFIDGSNTQDVYEFLKSKKLIDDLVKEELHDRKDKMIMKKYQVIADHLSVSGNMDLNILNRFNIKSIINENFNTLPEVFHQLYHLVSNIDRDKHVIEKSDETLFYTCKVREENLSRSHIDLVNHLISNYTPYSYLRMINYNHSLFVKSFETWNTSKRKYVIRYLQQHIDIG